MRYVAITRGAIIGLVVSYVAILAAFILLWIYSGELHDQQARTTRLATQAKVLAANTRRLTIQNCRHALVLHDILLAALVNQPGVDPRLVQVLTAELDRLPKQCP